MEALVKIVGGIVLVVAAICLLAFLLTLPVWLLWNWLVPIVFPGEFIAHHITFWQALGISLLSSCLFKSSSVKAS